MDQWALHKEKAISGSTKKGEPRKQSSISQKKFLLNAGLAENSIHNWRSGTTPNLSNFDAACNLFGYRLTVVKIADEREEDDNP